MSTLQVHINSKLTQAVQLTGRLRRRRARSGLAAKLFAAADFVARAVFYVWRNHRYLTLPKLANMALANLCFGLKTEYVPARPFNMKIEATNICNTSCRLCPTGAGISGRAKGKIDLQQYRSIIDKVRWHVLALDLSMWGDPLIVPQIYDMIRYAHDRRIWTYLSSNLHAFKPDSEQPELLVRSGLDLLTCSLHGASQETYEKYQPNKRFDKVVQKVQHIVETRRRLASATPVVQLNFVVTRYNEHERESFAALANELDCKAVFSPPAMNVRFIGLDKNLRPLGLTEADRKSRVLDHLRQWLPADQRYVLAPYRRILDGRDGNADFNGRKPVSCSWPWRSSVVNWDGQVAACCGGFDPAEDMGNTFDQSFGRIWNGKRYRMARRTFKHKVTADQAKDNPCASCPGFML